MLYSVYQALSSASTDQVEYNKSWYFTYGWDATDTTNWLMLYSVHQALASSVTEKDVDNNSWYFISVEMLQIIHVNNVWDSRTAYTNQ